MCITLSNSSSGNIHIASGPSLKGRDKCEVAAEDRAIELEDLTAVSVEKQIDVHVLRFNRPRW